jgi:hypothetical protein
LPKELLLNILKQFLGEWFHVNYLRRKWMLL